MLQSDKNQKKMPEKKPYPEATGYGTINRIVY